MHTTTTFHSRYATPPQSESTPRDGDPEEEQGSDRSSDRFGSSPHEPGNHHIPAMLASDRLVLSVTEAGELLGLSRAFAYELVARGELPVIRFGRRIVVPKAALLELLGAAVSGT
jgi:excisionase family DNA binding protein